MTSTVDRAQTTVLEFPFRVDSTSRLIIDYYLACQSTEELCD